MRFAARRYDTGEAVAVTLSDTRIAALEHIPDNAVLPWLAPALWDLQVNGYGGQEFNDRQLTCADVLRLSTAMDALGVSAYCPTATTHSREMLQHVMQTIASACVEFPEVDARVIGIHLEGPYLSAEDGPRGAHPLEHCRPPDWAEFQFLQEAAQGRIRILTMSPEFDDSAKFIERVVASGVLVAIGHTAADSEQIRAAVDAGARLSTHLGNGAHGQLRRHPNYIWDQLAEDRLTASLIVDGHHLPPSVVKSFVRAKTPARCILVSDITGMAGMPPGRYESSSLAEVEVLADGRLVVAGQRQFLAGAALPLLNGVENVMRFAEVELRAAIDMACGQPANLLGLTPPRLEVGAPADLILFHLQDLKVELAATIRAGNVVFGDLPKQDSRADRSAV